MRIAGLFLFLFAFSFGFFFPLLATTEAGNATPSANPAGPYQGTAGLPVSFDGGDSFDDDGDVLTYWWDFGDGTSDIGPSPSHTYAAPGIFTVTLTVRDVAMASNTASTTATILPGAATSPTEPLDGARAISLNEQNALTLAWNQIQGAEQYKYKLWKQGDNVPEDSKLITTTATLSYIAGATLTPGASYLWQVQACSPTGCGAWSKQWSFTYLLLPPPAASISFVPPATILWNHVPGAQSYEISFSTRLSCPSWLQNEVEKEVNGEKLLVRECMTLSSSAPSFTDDACILKPNQDNQLEIKACLGKYDLCTPGRGSLTGNIYIAKQLPQAPVLKAPFFNPAAPEAIPVVSQKDMLTWSVENGCAYGYKVILERPGQTVEKALDQPGEVSLLGDIAELWNDPADLNASYNWQVFSCLDEQGNTCEQTGSQTFAFRTMGAAPENMQPDNGAKVKIPFALSWENAHGTSYVYEVSRTQHTQANGNFEGATAQGITKDRAAHIPYAQDLIVPGVQYWWHVKTCADIAGTVCGPWSETKAFSALPLLAPVRPTMPGDAGTMEVPGVIRWEPDPGANYYQYAITYQSASAEETLPACQRLAGSQIIPEPGEQEPVTSSPAFSLPLFCQGEYRWRVRSCIDRDCTLASDYTPLWTFQAVPGPAPAFTGFIPCARTSNDLMSPYDERENCQIKHIGFLLQNLFDFAAWKLSLLLLVLLTMLSGVRAYISRGNPETFSRIRATFRSFFVGFLIVVLAWFVVNIVMILFGFQLQFFGTWWALPF